MAAVFYSPDPNSSMFKGGFQTSTAIKVPFLKHLINEDAMAIVTDIGIENNENIQYFLTFDDIISYFYFGGGLGNITIRGMLFMNCSGTMPGMEKFYRVIGANRGTPVMVSVGSVAFKALINNFSITSSAEPTMTADFQINLTVISQEGLQKPNFNTGCA